MKSLIDSGIINEETQEAIAKAWDEKLEEARQEIRQEFAQRYAHDKSQMVEALDKMVTDRLTAEMEEFHTETKALAEDRVKFKKHMIESAGKFNNFLVKKLSDEITELREDRKTYKNSIDKLEKFTVKALSEEIKEFAQDKQAVVETKVRLVAEAQEKIAKLQKDFVTRSAKLVQESVKNHLGKELTQLKEDIQLARENMFGRKLFEAFASEFAVTHLNENREFAKLKLALEEKDRVIAESVQKVEKAQKLIESREREIAIVKESAERSSALSNLLKNLNGDKAKVMAELLESVHTNQLDSAFKKYLPAVLNEKATPKKTVLSESIEITGDKSTANEQKDNNVVEIKRLAGLN